MDFDLIKQPKQQCWKVTIEHQGITYSKTFYHEAYRLYAKHKGVPPSKLALSAARNWHARKKRELKNITE